VSDYVVPDYEPGDDPSLDAMVERAIKLKQGGMTLAAAILQVVEEDDARALSEVEGRP
jgi:hypothetical protein